MIKMADVEKLTKIWDDESKSYRLDNASQPDYQADFYHLKNCLGHINNKNILEVGSGSGLASAYLASEGGILHLLDISKKSLDFAKKYFVFKKLPVKLYRQDAFKMKFPPQSFDYVWNGGVIEHFTDNEKVTLIEKMWELVRPGGKLYISVPNANDIPFMVAKKILQIRGKWSFGEEDDLTISRMKKLAAKAGLKKFSIYAYNPIVGIWFFPYGREITNILHLNTVRHHRERTPFGHVIVLYAQKPLR